MFAKAYKLKSTNSLKNSEKKQLVQRIVEAFPAAKEDRVKELIPVKGSASCLRLVLHSGETVAVFAADGEPLVIETEAGLVPTVCALWKVPELVPTITIHTPVLGKIASGAPLYLPGVEIPHHGVGFPMFARGAIIAANTTDNMAAGVVGRATISSGDVLLRAAGVCLDTIHVIGDQLCKEQKFSKIERPRFGTAAPTSSEADLLTSSISELCILTAQKPAREEWPALGSAPPTAPRSAPAPASATNAPRVIADRLDKGDNPDETNDSMASECLEDDELSIPEDMDGLLRWSLLTFLRLEGKTIELPIKTSLLYRNHLLPLCPPERTLDVKKSTYKKMGKFLEAMQREGLVEVREVERGVDALVGVNLAHPAVRAHRPPPGLRERIQAAQEEKPQTDYVPPAVREVLCVTAAVADLFPGVKKGSALSPAEVREALTARVRERGLAAPPGLRLDAALAAILRKPEQEVVGWEAALSGVRARMTAGTELRDADGSARVLKQRLEPVTMAVVTRSGNKKVTLVNNLEAYGFHLAALSTACQRAAGASCGVTRSAGARHDQLMLQGDQTHFMAKLLVERYGLPKKFIEGADKLLNKKK